MPAVDAPPVTFGVKVIAENPGHVTFLLFAGRTPDSRGRSGQLVLRADEYPEFLRRLAPEAVIGLSTDQCPLHTWRCPSCVCVLTVGHAGLCDVHCQGPDPRGVVRDVG
jgi:hypothetical protein